ncbi:MAG: hypothetical protein ABI770_10195 [Sphingomicrobium sp.]
MALIEIADDLDAQSDRIEQENASRGSDPPGENERQWRRSPLPELNRAVSRT